MTVASQASERAQRKTREGTVISNKMQKTIVVQVSRMVRHEVYNRYIPQASSFKVHNEKNVAAIGDFVRIMETRPISKDKRWRLVEVLKRASNAPPLPDSPPEPAVKTLRRGKGPAAPAREPEASS